MRSGLKRLLGHRMAYGEIIPPDTRVDPAGFPEAEFPVFCPQCDYELRGLPENRCPECGRPFDRGRLLVAQYTDQSGRPKQRLRRRLGNWLLVCAWVLCLPSLAGRLLEMQMSLMSLIDVTFLSLASFLSMAGGILVGVSRDVGKTKRVAVLAAIDRSTDEYQRAQQSRWFMGTVAVAVLLIMLVLLLSSNDDWRRYSPGEPYLLIAPLVAIFVAISMICFMLRRRRKDKG